MNIVKNVLPNPLVIDLIVCFYYSIEHLQKYRINIPDGCHWKDVRETTSNVGLVIEKALRGILAIRHNQRHLLILLTQFDILHQKHQIIV